MIVPRYVTVGVVAATILWPLAVRAEAPKRVRFATFNVAMNRGQQGQLANELRTSQSKQAQAIAEIIQRVRPDVLLLNEFDFDAESLAARRFADHYLSVSQNGLAPIAFPHRFSAEVNTGLPSGHDLDNDGRTDGPGDAFGFGSFPGQYGMLVLSKMPINREQVRTFRTFLWRDIPEAQLPQIEGRPFYTDAELRLLRLSSKSHWDLPIQIDGATVHFLCSHPTPPVFDGPEDRNGIRNHDEIRFWADYIHPQRSSYIVDDAGKRGGLPEGAHFVIAGDMNADPLDGDSMKGAIDQLLSHVLIQAEPAPASTGAVAKSARDGGINEKHRGDPAHDTSDFRDENVGNLRLDYVLPARTLTIAGSGVFWPKPDESGGELVEASDHRLVWLDIER